LETKSRMCPRLLRDDVHNPALAIRRRKRCRLRVEIFAQSAGCSAKNYLRNYVSCVRNGTGRSASFRFQAKPPLHRLFRKAQVRVKGSGWPSGPNSRSNEYVSTPRPCVGPFCTEGYEISNRWIAEADGQARSAGLTILRISCASL